MLAKRIIPTLLLDHGKLVKGRNFSHDRVVGNPVQAAKVFGLREVDELVIFDVSARRENRPPDFETIAKMCSACFVPTTVGGGIRNIEDAKRILRDCCADKIALGAHAPPGLAKAIACIIGKQSVVAVIKAIDELYAELVDGIGEIIAQSISRDGTMAGYDLGYLESVVARVDCPVVASSGCGSFADMDAALSVGADAVAAGAFWQFTDATPQQAKEYLGEKGWTVRIT